MAVYVNDAIWRRLSDYYGVTADQAQVGDLYKRWLDENGLSWQNAGDFFMSQFPGVVNRADAEWLFWTYGLGDDLVLLLDAAQESQSGVAAQVVKNRGDRRVGDAQLGSSSGVDSNDPVWLPHDGTNYVYLPGVAGNHMTVGNDAAFNVTGDAEWIIDVAMDDWTPSAAVDLVVRGNADPNRAFQVRLQTNGTVRLSWWPSGSSASGISVASTGTVPFADGQRGQIKVSLDVDNGSGQYVVTMATSTDNTTWTPLTMPAMPSSGTTSLPSVTASVGVFYGNLAGAAPFNGKGYRFRMLNGIGGTTVLDVDTSVITSGDATSFTATTGQTVTISRSTSGKKSVAVTRPCWLFGTNSYMEVADNDLLDFGASDSFTVIAVLRQWGTPTNFGRYLSKRPGSGAGWELETTGTTLAPAFYIQDATNPLTTTSVRPTMTAGAISVVGSILDRSGSALAMSLNGAVSASTSVSAYGSLANASALRIGAISATNGGYQDFELMAVAVVRRALTETEIGYVNQYFTITPSLPTPTPEPVPWAPTSMTGLELWLDAADTSTITSSSLKVSEWRDKSGENRHVTQGTAAAQPTSNVSTQNGLNVVEFDGGDSLVSVSPASVWKFLHDGTNYMVGVVTARDIAGVNGTIIATKNAAASIGVHIHFGASNILRHNVQDGANAVVSNEPAIGTSTAARLFTILADPDNATAADRSTIFLEDDSGSKLNLQVLSPSASNPASTLAVGDRPSSPVPLNGFICELVIVSGADANETNRVLLRDYLSTKWGV